MNLASTLNFIPKTLESSLGFVNKNLAKALNFTTKSFQNLPENLKGEEKTTDWGTPVSDTYKGFAGNLALQAGVQEKDLESNAPVGRLATAGLLVNLASPSKGIGMISEGLPGAKGLSSAIGGVVKKASDTFQGFPDLTTKLLEKLKGRTEVSKQFISDLTNSPDLKQVEKDVIRNVLDTYKQPIKNIELARKELEDAFYKWQDSSWISGGEPFKNFTSILKKYPELGEETIKHIPKDKIFKVKDFPNEGFITVYRGGSEPGASYTLDKKVAERFIRDESDYLEKTDELLSNVAYYGGGDEEEIIFKYDLPDIIDNSKISVQDFANKVKAELLKLNKATLDPLAQEATKYKSAEEFVKAQPIVYHGTSADFKNFDISKSGKHDFGTLGEGFYFTDNIEHASYKQNRVIEAHLDIKNPYQTNKFWELTGKDKSESKAFTEKLKSKGYDGIIATGKDAEGKLTKWYVAFSPNQIKTKSQLTDIWNKANKGEVKPLAQEARGLEQKTIDKFGITNNPLESLYITTDGKYLGNKGFKGGGEHQNFSETILGKNYVKDGLPRYALPQKTGMLEIVDTGKGGELNVRIYTEPTPQQIAKIKEISVDRKEVFIDDYRGLNPKTQPPKSYTKETMFDIWNKANKGEVKPTKAFGFTLIPITEEDENGDIKIDPTGTILASLGIKSLSGKRSLMIKELESHYDRISKIKRTPTVVKALHQISDLLFRLR